MRKNKKEKSITKSAVDKSLLSSFCFLVVMLVIAVGVAFVAINPVTDFIHKVESRVSLQIRDIVIDDSTYNRANGLQKMPNSYNYGEKIGVITSDAFELNNSIYCGSNRASMAEGVGFDNKTTLIGKKGTSILVGYAESAFSSLEYAEEDDIIRISTNYGDYTYKITEMKYMKKADKSFEKSGSSLVLCALCSDFSDHSGENLVVFADMVNREVQ